MCSPCQLSHLLATQPALVASSPDLTGARYVDIHWGQQYCQRGQWEKAENKFATALAYFARSQDLIGVGKSLNGLSALYFEQGSPSRSLTYSQAAAAILEDTAAKYEYAIALYQLGISHCELQNIFPAEQSLEKALTQFCQLSNLEYENHSLIYLGRIYAQQHKFLFALACYESVLDSLIVNPFLENRREMLSTVLRAVAELSQQHKAGKAMSMALQSVLEEYGLAAYHLQVATHLQ
ncbi:MAG: hypothetical protein AAF622_17430 [Cyanobacteria bacterium P01_C01_bin.147]